MTALLSDDKEMLSPDVPEFVPRNFQNVDSSSGVGHLENTVSKVAPNSYSQSHRYSLNHGVCNSGSWRREPAEKAESLNRSKSGQGENKSDSFSNSKWRNAGNNDWNRGKLKEEASLNERQNGREKNRQQSILRPDNYEFSGKNKNWRDRNKQVQSSDRGKGLEQHDVEAPFSKSNDTFLKVSGSATQNMPTESNASQSNKLRHFPDKNDPQLKQSDAGSKPSRGNRGSQIGGLVFSSQFRHQDDISYKKVLSRKNFIGDSLEKADAIDNGALFQSQEQWPSLSVTHSQNSSANPVNAWIKNNDQKPASWSRPGRTDINLNSGPLQKAVSEGTNNDNVYPNSNIVVKKEWNHNDVNNGKNFQKKNKKNYQSYNKTSKVLNCKTATNANNSEGNTSDTKKMSENSTYSKEKDVFSESNSAHCFTDVSLNQKAAPNTSELKPEVMRSSSTEGESSEWQVQKKKKNKVKEQLESALKSTDKSITSNKEAKFNKRDYSHNKYAKNSKYDTTKKINLSTGDKTKRCQLIGDKCDTYDNGKERVKVSVHEHSEKRINKFVKAKNYDGIPRTSHKSTKAKGGNDVKETDSVDSKSKGSSSLQNKKNLESNDSNFQRFLVPLADKDTLVKDEKAKKASIEKKAKIKEEKMRKKELKIKKAQAKLASDSKVTMVSKETLEMMYRGQYQNSGKIAGNVSRNKVDNTESVHRRGEIFRYSLESYPGLIEHHQNQGTEDEMSPVNDESLEPISLRKSRSGWNAGEKKGAKFQNSLTGRKTNDTGSSFSSEDDKSKRAITFNIHNAEGKSELSVQESVSSYSKALLTAASKKIVKQKPTHEVSTPKINNPKKKVKIKDEMTINLFDAVAIKVKKKDSSNLKNQTQANNQVDFDPVTMAINERIQNRSRILIGALDHETRRKHTWDRNWDRGNCLLSGLDGKSTKPRTEIVAKRGKQREGQKKKKLSALKKAIKRARQQEVENLLYVLQEAKKLQERSIPDGTSATCTSPFETSKTVLLSETPETFTAGREMEISTEAVDNGDLKVLPTKDKEISDDARESNCEPKENKLSETEISPSNESAPGCDRREAKANEINLKEDPNNIIDPDFALKCKKILNDMDCLNNSVHKRSFREYCNHIITPEVNVTAKELISTLVTFQDRHFKRDPMKARMRRRFVCGLRSTVKSMGKLSCIIVAPDIERCKGPGALDEVVENMLKQAENHCVPVIFALTCKKIGYLCFKKVGVSCIGIINYHGAQVVFQKLMEMIPEAKAQYQERVSRGFCTVPVGDEPPDDESASIQESAKAAETSIINKEFIKSSSMANQQNTREEIIASTVAILNEPSSEKPISSGGKSSVGCLTANEAITFIPTVSNKHADEELAKDPILRIPED
ncbi:serine-rich adhesin for platelets [Palaemon carinicauda]|uniref:serine-rich adhesin for platelets n=1 Tax=Palaemon carinicauda TaxID=392227 RepID=UPI0035B5E361